MEKQHSSHHGGQEAERKCLNARLSPFHFYPIRAPAYGMVPPTFGECLPLLILSRNVLTDIPKACFTDLLYLSIQSN
jgi:hypothetical protein